MLTPFKPKSREIKKVERKGNALFLYSDNGILVLDPKSENIVRVIYTVQEELSKKEKPGIVLKDSFEEWNYKETEKTVELFLNGVTVCVRKDSGSVSYYSAGKL